MMLESTLVNGGCFKCAIEIQFVLYCIVLYSKACVNNTVAQQKGTFLSIFFIDFESN